MEEDKTIGKYEIDSIAFWEGKKIVKNNTKEKIYYDRFAFQCYTDQIAQISGLFFREN